MKTNDDMNHVQKMNEQTHCIDCKWVKLRDELLWRLHFRWWVSVTEEEL